MHQISFSIHLLLAIRLRLFLAIVSSAEINVGVQVSLWSGIKYLGSKPRSGYMTYYLDTLYLFHGTFSFSL